jgi:hypothetical protein
MYATRCSPSKRYYNIGKTSIASTCSSNNKILVFSTYQGGLYAEQANSFLVWGYQVV